ncbi:MAG TPA: SGNH/GDSL hydrolase family protein [Bryobacteraceae bacterium]|nr:SGNH/GDSL hydrolase family protein [Bryobacteraceae bacterium]
MKRTLLFALPFLAVSLCSGQTTAPAAAGTQQAPTPPDLQKQLDRDERVLHDYGNLARYRDDDAKLPPPAAGENRVVFMGDSITDNWGHKIGPFFPGKPYVNRGISGQVTSQMLLRFRPDVINLQPKVVVILAGTNDIGGNMGPASDEMIEGNLASMADLARANNIKVVLASLTPVCDYHQPQTAKRPPDRILAINAWITKYAADHGIVVLNYFPHMIDDKGMFRAELTADGLHPNAAGYEIMAPLAEEAISKALQQ